MQQTQSFEFKNKKQKISLFKNFERIIVPDDNKDHS